MKATAEQFTHVSKCANVVLLFKHGQLWNNNPTYCRDPFWRKHKLALPIHSVWFVEGLKDAVAKYILVVATTKKGRSSGEECEAMVSSVKSQRIIHIMRIWLSCKISQF